MQPLQFPIQTSHRSLNVALSFLLDIEGCLGSFFGGGGVPSFRGGGLVSYFCRFCWAQRICGALPQTSHFLLSYFLVFLWGGGWCSWLGGGGLVSYYCRSCWAQRICGALPQTAHS